jgi:hypothetical protein
MIDNNNQEIELRGELHIKWIPETTLHRVPGSSRVCVDLLIDIQTHYMDNVWG